MDPITDNEWFQRCCYKINREFDSVVAETGIDLLDLYFPVPPSQSLHNRTTSEDDEPILILQKHCSCSIPPIFRNTLWAVLDELQISSEAINRGQLSHLADIYSEYYEHYNPYIDYHVRFMDVVLSLIMEDADMSRILTKVKIVSDIAISTVSQEDLRFLFIPDFPRHAPIDDHRTILERIPEIIMKVLPVEELLTLYRLSIAIPIR